MFRRVVSIAGVLCAAWAVPLACSSSSSPSGPSGPPGGAAAGLVDTHCAGGIKQQTNDTACHPGDAGADASVADASGPTSGSTYGATMFNAEGDDDACKYHLSWTSDPIYENTNVTFHLTAMKKFDGVWACGADPYVEVFLDDTHPAPNSSPHASEVGTGTYDIGPIRFDAKGRWTVRFHLYGDCSDLTPDSPHGHAAFYVDVP